MGVKLLPNVHEVLDFVLFNWQLKVIGLLQEGIYDDRNEQVDKDLGDQDVKQDEEGVRGYRGATCESFAIVLHH